MSGEQSQDEQIQAFATWSKKNSRKLQPMMPLTAFLRELPWGIVRDASDAVEPSLTAKGLALLFMFLHSPNADGSVNESLERLCDSFAAMAVACAFELNRRLGVHRYTVDGDDTLLGAGKIIIELNPALDPWIRAGVAPILDRDDPIADQIIRTAMSTSWCDHASISGPEYGT